MPNTMQIETKQNGDFNYLSSPRLWASCPWNDLLEGKNADRRGFAFAYNFANLKTSTNVNAAEAYWNDGFMLFGSDGAAVSLLDDDGGGGATFGSDGDNEGVGLRTVAAPFQVSQDHGDLWLEWAWRTSTVADTKHGFVGGLRTATAVTATAPIAADGTLADNNQIVFWRKEGDGDQLDVAYKADGQTAVEVDTDVLDGTTPAFGGTLPSALAADTVYKTGIKYTKRGHRKGDYRVSFFFDGIELAAGYNVTSTAGNPFPNDVRLGFVFSLLNATASTPGTTSLLWVRGAQIGVN